MVVVGSGNNIATDTGAAECIREGRCEANDLEVRIDRERDPGAKEVCLQSESAQIGFSDDDRSSLWLLNESHYLGKGNGLPRRQSCKRKGPGIQIGLH